MAAIALCLRQVSWGRGQPAPLDVVASPETRARSVDGSGIWKPGVSQLHGHFLRALGGPLGADRDCFPTPPPAAFRAFQLGRAHRTCLRHSALPEVLLSKVSVLSNSKLQISPNLSSCTSVHYLYILSLKKKNTHAAPGPMTGTEGAGELDVSLCSGSSQV